MRWFEALSLAAADAAVAAGWKLFRLLTPRAVSIFDTLSHSEG